MNRACRRIVFSFTPLLLTSWQLPLLSSRVYLLDEEKSTDDAELLRKRVQSRADEAKLCHCPSLWALGFFTTLTQRMNNSSLERSEIHRESQRRSTTNEETSCKRKMCRSSQTPRRDRPARPHEICIALVFVTFYKSVIYEHGERSADSHETKN